jgi:D-proline reductase (dithiol) PrdB
MISTAGLHHRDDRPFTIMSGDYRIIPGDIAMNDLVMSHISTNFDRTGFQQDWNVVFPLDRLRELADQGFIGSVADFHYSFMGATDPKLMEKTARDLAGLLKKDRVDAVLLVPV